MIAADDDDEDEDMEEDAEEEKNTNEKGSAAAATTNNELLANSSSTTGKQKQPPSTTKPASKKNNNVIRDEDDDEDELNENEATADEEESTEEEEEEEEEETPRVSQRAGLRRNRSGQFRYSDADSDGDEEEPTVQKKTFALSTPSIRVTHSGQAETVVLPELSPEADDVIETIIATRMFPPEKPPASEEMPDANAATAADSDVSSTTSSSTKRETPINVRKYLVKFKGKSYMHTRWVTEEWILDQQNGKARLQRFHKKKAMEGVSMEDTPVVADGEELEEADFFNPNYLEVDRILEIGTFSVDQRKMFLCKWKGLPYNESTWEFESDVRDDAKIEQFKRFCTPPATPGLSSSRIVRGNFKKLTESPVFKNNNLLREYQLEGLNWLSFCWHQRRSSILADEMGLGKTVQTVSIMEWLRTTQNIRGPFIIIAPLSTIEHWKREFEGWTDMNVVVYHGPEAAREMIHQYEWYFRDPKTGKNIPGTFKFNTIITTYEMVLNAPPQLQQINWEYMVIDEGHRLKNRQSKLLGSLFTFKSDIKLLLTGTPLQNDMKELWTLLNFIQSDRFPSMSDFIAKFGNLNDSEEVKKLHEVIRPYLLRRMKEDVEKSIPPKEEIIVEVEPTLVQKKYYKAILEKNREFLKRGIKKAANIPSLMNVMMEIRKVCNHPFLIKGAEDRILDEYIQQMQAQHGSSFEYLVRSSSKMVLVDKLLQKLRAGNHKVLIFSQMVRMLDILEDYIKHRRYPYERLDGRIRGNERQAAIDRFSAPGSDAFVFLLCTRAGGIGINLTAADTVIIYDSDWNPQNDLQAQARAHRIGQTSDVKVYRLVTKDTKEKEMLDRASKKLGLDKVVLAMDTDRSSEFGGSGSKQTLDKEEINALLKYGAYALYKKSDQETSEEERRLLEGDIDQILERSSTVIKFGSSETPTNNGPSTFSKATFFTDDANPDININDEDFWEKTLPAELTPSRLLSRLTQNGNASLSDEERTQYFSDLKALVEEAIITKERHPELSTFEQNDSLIGLLIHFQHDTRFSEKQRSMAEKWRLQVEKPRLRSRGRGSHSDLLSGSKRRGPIRVRIRLSAPTSDDEDEDKETAASTLSAVSSRDDVEEDALDDQSTTSSKKRRSKGGKPEGDGTTAQEGDTQQRPTLKKHGWYKTERDSVLRGLLAWGWGRWDVLQSRIDRLSIHSEFEIHQLAICIVEAFKQQPGISASDTDFFQMLIDTSITRLPFDIKIPETTIHNLVLDKFTFFPCEDLDPHIPSAIARVPEDLIWVYKEIRKKPPPDPNKPVITGEPTPTPPAPAQTSPAATSSEDAIEPENPVTSTNTTAATETVAAPSPKASTSNASENPKQSPGDKKKRKRDRKRKPSAAVEASNHFKKAEAQEAKEEEVSIIATLSASKDKILKHKAMGLFTPGYSGKFVLEIVNSQTKELVGRTKPFTVSGMHPLVTEHEFSERIKRLAKFNTHAKKMRLTYDIRTIVEEHPDALEKMDYREIKANPARRWWVAEDDQNLVRGIYTFGLDWVAIFKGCNYAERLKSINEQLALQQPQQSSSKPSTDGEKTITEGKARVDGAMSDESEEEGENGENGENNAENVGENGENENEVPSSNAAAVWPNAACLHKRLARIMLYVKTKFARDIVYYSMDRESSFSAASLPVSVMAGIANASTSAPSSEGGGGDEEGDQSKMKRAPKINAEWSKREKLSFKQVLLQYGKMPDENGAPQWDKIIAKANLAKLPEHCETQFGLFWAACQKMVANQKTETDPQVDPVDEELTLITAKRVLDRVLLINDLQPILKKERAWPTLRSLKKSGLPNWWGYKHDVALLETVREYGLDLKNLCKREAFQGQKTKFPREGLIQLRLQHIVRWFKKLSRVSKSRGAFKAAARVSAQNKQLRMESFLKPLHSENDNAMEIDEGAEDESDDKNQLQRRQRRRRRPKHFDEINDNDAVEEQEDIEDEDDEDFVAEDTASPPPPPPPPPPRKRNRRSASKPVQQYIEEVEEEEDEEDGFWVEDAENEMTNFSDVQRHEESEGEVTPDEFSALPIPDQEDDVFAPDMQDEEEEQPPVVAPKFVTPSSRKPPPPPPTRKRSHKKKSPKKTATSSATVTQRNLLQLVIKTNRDSKSPSKRPRDSEVQSSDDENSSKRSKREVDGSSPANPSSPAAPSSFGIAALGSQPTTMEHDPTTPDTASSQ